MNFILHLEAALVFCGASCGAVEASALPPLPRPPPLQQKPGHQSLLAARQFEGCEG